MLLTTTNENFVRLICNSRLHNDYMVPSLIIDIAFSVTLRTSIMLRSSSITVGTILFLPSGWINYFSTCIAGVAWFMFPGTSITGWTSFWFH